MALPVIADVFRVTLNWLGDNSTAAHNVLHISAPTDDETSLMAKLEAHVLANMWAPSSDDCNIQDVDILKLDGSSSGVNFETSHGSKWAGQEGGQPLIAPAAIVKLATGLRGPRHRGRVFLPFVAEDVTDNGTLNPTTAGLTTTAWVSFANALVADDCAIGVASYVHSDWNQAINLRCEIALGTMRRRQNAVRRTITS